MRTSLRGENITVKNQVQIRRREKPVCGEAKERRRKEEETRESTARKNVRREGIKTRG